MCVIYEPDTRLLQALTQSSNLLSCLGNDINRQIISVLSSVDTNGMRVPEITKKTFLSRPSVTSHIKELQDAGIVRVLHQGTMNYYYLHISDSSLQTMKELFDSMEHYYHLQEEKE